MKRLPVSGGLLFAAVLAFPSAWCEAGPKSTVGRNWPAGQLVPMDRIDHQAWDQLLQKYVDTDGLVNYRAWQASPTDRTALREYLETLSQANPAAAASREAQLAFWINAYNAVTIDGILQKYPTDSIRNHTARLFGYNIWHDLLLIVGPQQVSLDQMEHKILRPMGEPRIHFAIVCASIGCPRLLNRAYLPDELDSQLTENTRQFFSDPKKLRWTASRRQIDVSPILKWFAEDFGTTPAERAQWIAPYLPIEQARQLAARGQVTLRYLDYDWKLNEQ